MEKIRVQKILSRRGYGSRRDCEKLIEEKRVLINGNIAKLGDRANPARDSILVDGTQIPKDRQEYFYIAFNKPNAVLSDTKRKSKRKIITDFVNLNEYYFVVGRLDFHSEGLILITNDGELANRMTHPRYEHEKEYEVTIGRKVDNDQIEIWRNGVVLEDGYRTLPAEIKVLNSSSKITVLKIIMREGKKRQIREVGKRIGLPVGKINRTRISTLHLGDLKTGEWRYLTKTEEKAIRHSAGLV